MPLLRAFRALRYDLQRVGDLGAVIAPPYDVVSPEEAAALRSRHPYNVIRVELPPEEPGGSPDRYRRAAETLARWRTEGILRKDPRPSVYPYELRYRVPGTEEDRVQRGFFARLRLEDPGREGGVLPHERTLTAPKEDRYRLLRATGTNTSAVVVIAPDEEGTVSRLLTELTASPPTAMAVDERVEHRLWVHPGDDETAQALLTAAGRAPLVIADGHHRYETALRYRDERRMTRSCEEDPPFDYVLALVVPASQPLTVLPTHRIVTGLGDHGVEEVLQALGDLFVVHPVESSRELVGEFGPLGSGGRGRFGLVSRAGLAVLEARPEAWALIPPGAARLDVVLLAALLERLVGLDAAAAASGERLRYTKAVHDVVAAVAGDGGGGDLGFLLAPTPVEAVIAAARAGITLPQKSTYFYPKAATGLVLNPLEG